MKVSFQAFQGSNNGEIVSVETSYELGPNQVFIETTHSGVCGTDEIFRHSELALGHEGVGIVRQVGSDVISVHVGNRVGFAYVQKVCGSCDMCTTGESNFLE
jgi:D-arabinose 1-dehydrogenase-like Zn-dependent alcohol dehydrogenase